VYIYIHIQTYAYKYIHIYIYTALTECYAYGMARGGEEREGEVTMGPSSHR
jgi:hypothetical protein